MRVWLRRLLLSVVLAMSLSHCSRPAALPPRTPVLLAIFAHPDDEASIGPVLAKYAAGGVKVYLAVATDGALGVTEHAGLTAGGEVAATRANELQCASQRLGLQPPIVFGLQDQLKMAEGLDTHSRQIRELRRSVLRLFDRLQPDAVITWSASGWTGHPDHRLVSSVVTEVFQSEQWTRPARLFFPAIPVGRLPLSHPVAAAMVDPRWLSAEIKVDPANYQQAKQAWLCHSSQYTPAMIEQLHQSMVTAQQGIAHFMAMPQPRGTLSSLLPQDEQP